MIIAFGCDHAGYPVKEKITEFLKSKGHTVIDCGCFSEESCDYPDYAIAVARKVSKGVAERGILVCGTGIGMSIAANKIRGIRAAVCYSEETAVLSRKHNDANILCIGSRFFNISDILRWIDVWLETPFEGGRHERRIKKFLSMGEK